MRYRGGELEGAVADFTKALSLDGRFARAHLNRGLVFLLQGREEEAARDLGRAVALAPELGPQAEAVANLRRQAVHVGTGHLQVMMVRVGPVGRVGGDDQNRSRLL